MEQEISQKVGRLLIFKSANLGVPFSTLFRNHVEREQWLTLQ